MKKELLKVWDEVKKTSKVIGLTLLGIGLILMIVFVIFGSKAFFMASTTFFTFAITIMKISGSSTDAILVIAQGDTKEQARLDRVASIAFALGTVFTTLILMVAFGPIFFQLSIADSLSILAAIWYVLVFFVFIVLLRAFLRNGRPVVSNELKLALGECVKVASLRLTNDPERVLRTVRAGSRSFLAAFGAGAMLYTIAQFVFLLLNT